MQIITTHKNSDFDALASVVACTFLYPGAVGYLPGQMAPGVRSFLSIHQDMLHVKPRKELDVDSVKSLIIVDVNNWNRLDGLEKLAQNDELEVICWDHHMEGVTIERGEHHREEVGATVTLLLEEMELKDSAFTPMHATLFLLGIYADTGCLRFPSSTARDARMVAYLLENGADLNVVSAYLEDSVDDTHSEVFSNMLSSTQIIDMNGLSVGISVQTVKNGLTMLAPLVTKYKEFKGLDAAFGVFQTGLDKCLVIGRGSAQGVDVGSVVRGLGGGGHPGAGSAAIKGSDSETILEQLVELIGGASSRECNVEDIMSAPEPYMINHDVTMAHVLERCADKQLSGVMVCAGHKFLGTLSVEDCYKAKQNGRLDTSVKGFVKRQTPTVEKRSSSREALHLMNKAKEGVLAVVEESTLVGVLTRSDIILQLYDF